MRLENTPKFYPHGARVHHGQPFLLPNGQPFLLTNGNSKYANDNIYQLTS